MLVATFTHRQMVKMQQHSIQHFMPWHEAYETSKYAREISENVRERKQQQQQQNKTKLVFGL